MRGMATCSGLPSLEHDGWTQFPAWTLTPSVVFPTDRIAQNPRTIVCPMIDVIDHNHFGYEAQAGDTMRGAFDWEMYYKRIPIPPELQSVDPSEPYQSPVMAGGLFAVSRHWFWELGGYDTGLEIWGGEQYELSFKSKASAVVRLSARLFVL
ncbi:polypeptide N-acetylgalactosaminyltransferase-like 6 [Arapaima gigas]